MKKILFLSFLVFLGCENQKNKKQITFEKLLNELSDREALTYFSGNYVSKMASSYDRHSKEKDSVGWFANHDGSQFIREEKRNNTIEKVMMEDEGPGAIVRIWITATTVGILRVYLDGNEKPTIKMEAADLIGGKKLIGKPFSFKVPDREVREYYNGANFFTGQGEIEQELDLRGSNFYLPIPYQKSCKVTLEPKNSVAYYYQINYRKYKPKTKVQTFNLDFIKKYQKTLESVGEKLSSSNRKITGKKIVKKDITLEKEKYFQIDIKAKNQKPQAIHKIKIVLGPADYQQSLHTTVLSIAFDGKQTVWAPIGSLAGVGHSDKSNQTYFVKVNHFKREINLYFVMPFQKTAKMELTNYFRNPIRIEKLSITQKNYDWNEKSRYFHAAWFEKNKIQTKEKKDLNLLSIKKSSGRFIGLSLSVFNYYTMWNNGRMAWWGEGDDKFYVDEEKFPSIFGTGTEDYFGYAWCRPEEFHKPFISQPNGGANKKPGYTNNNRYHILDDVPFQKSLDFDMEVWTWTQEKMDYDVTTFFYAEKNANVNKIPNPESLKKYTFN